MLIISQDLLTRMEAYLQAHYPDEGAGLLLGRQANGRDVEVDDFIPVTNVFKENERHHRYKIDPMEMLRAENLADALDTSVLGVIHSHPDHPSVPSDYDREYALPWFHYLITRIQAGKAAGTQAWRLRNDRSGFDEMDLNITPVRRKEATA